MVSEGVDVPSFTSRGGGHLKNSVEVGMGLFFETCLFKSASLQGRRLPQIQDIVRNVVSGEIVET